MKFTNKLITLLLFAVCICVFGVFIYPGIYKYDKLNQKLPVQINRLTGETKVLTSDGWIDMNSVDSANNKMESYKKEIEHMISEQNEYIKNSVLEEVREEIENVKKEALSASNAGSGGSFTIGDSNDKVKEVMGTPSRINEVGPYSTWYYGNSQVKFKNNKVNGWEDLDGNLLIE